MPSEAYYWQAPKKQVQKVTVIATTGHWHLCQLPTTEIHIHQRHLFPTPKQALENELAKLDNQMQAIREEAEQKIANLQAAHDTITKLKDLMNDTT